MGRKNKKSSKTQLVGETHLNINNILTNLKNREYTENNKNLFETCCKCDDTLVYMKHKNRYYCFCCWNYLV
jgi:hypothetical protein